MHAIRPPPLEGALVNPKKANVWQEIATCRSNQQSLNMKMTRLAQIFFVVSTSLVALSATAQTGESAKVSAHINAQMDRWESFYRKKDAKGIEAIIRGNFAKSFVDTAKDGTKMNLEQFVASHKMHLAGTKSVSKLNVKMSNVKVQGSNGTGKGSLHLEGVIFDQNDPKKTHTLKVEAKWNSTLKKVNGKWWIVADTTTHEKQWIDGKPTG